MQKGFLKTVFHARGVFNRHFKKASEDIKLEKPLSRRFGFDRGTPIDRFYIDLFLSENKNLIKGRVLEIGDNIYTKTYDTNVTKSDVLDVNKKNKKANITGDLRNLKSKIKENTYDTVLLTHVLGLIDDLEACVSEVYRILKPGGNVLVSSAVISPNFSDNKAHWRILGHGLKYLFGKKFKKIKIKDYGNFVGFYSFVIGMAQEELDKKKLIKHDSDFPCIATLIATK
jgi:SAM-dependent methyltransferase